MKQTVTKTAKLFLAFFIFCSEILLAQNFPYGFNYQAVVRDANGSAKTNTAVGVRLSIRKGTNTGTIAYQETQSPTTNALGQFNLVVGNGINTNLGSSPSFSVIPWQNDIYFLQSEILIPPSTYTTIGTQQLMAVPYALHSRTIPPTIQRFLSGSGTYTPPSGVSYIIVKMVGGGGGASNVGGGSGGGGAAGGTTSFGSSLLNAGGGAGGTNWSGLTSGGGFNVNLPAIDLSSIGGADGNCPSYQGSGANSGATPGASGASSFFGGAGAAGDIFNAATNAKANSGSGGGGGGLNGVPSSAGGQGGAAGAYVEAMIVSPSGSYPFSIGTGGAGAGSGLTKGGNGGSGIIIIEEHH